MKCGRISFAVLKEHPSTEAMVQHSTAIRARGSLWTTVMMGWLQESLLAQLDLAEDSPSKLL
jgi:hypothetical protein